jgi:WD40 repeat protein
MGHLGGFISVAFSPDGLLMASGGAGGAVKVWDTTSWACLQALKGKIHDVYSVVFSPDGQKLASGGYKRVVPSDDDFGDNDDDFGDDEDSFFREFGVLHLWNSTSGEFLREFKGRDDAQVYSVAFSPTGQQLAGKWRYCQYCAGMGRFQRDMFARARGAH